MAMEKLSVLNPVGYPPKITAKQLAPRLDSLDGKTVYLVDPRFDDSGLFLRQLQSWFADHMPTAKTKLVEMNNVYTKETHAPDCCAVGWNSWVSRCRRPPLPLQATAGKTHRVRKRQPAQ